MYFRDDERIALFIDGVSLYTTAKALGFDIDYKSLLTYFRKRGHLVRAYYYTALAQDQEYSSIRPLIDWLDYNGYTIVTKPTKEFSDSFGRKKVKGNMDIELAVDAMRLAENVDHIVLFTGDGDFKALVLALMGKGKRVSVVSTLQTNPVMVADELRRAADQFIDIAYLQNEVGRNPAARAERPSLPDVDTSAKPDRPQRKSPRNICKDDPEYPVGA
ncbi:NYN domain-containing protein [bacterium]|nr:NYN domain-containing protein [bacterium]